MRFLDGYFRGFRCKNEMLAHAYRFYRDEGMRALDAWKNALADAETIFDSGNYK